MQFTKVYQYINEAEALVDIKQINDVLGIPKTPESTTQTYTISFEKDNVWYIVVDDLIKSIIGKEPIEIEINE